MPRTIHPNPDAGLGETILLVEDDLENLRITSFYLNNLGYHTLEASGAAEAVELAREHGSSIRLLLTAVATPCVSGVELAQQIRADRPELPVVFLVGYMPSPVSESMRTRFLRKPFTKRELAVLLRETLDAAEGAAMAASSMASETS